MSYNATLVSGCPAPFYNGAPFPETGGFIDGRICLPRNLTGGQQCCLPCPNTQWIFPESYVQVTDAAAWVNVFSLVLMCFVLLSYAIVPTQYTRSHYLNTCLFISVCLINLGFIVPRAAESNECYNEITPSDMYSSTSCAFSGAFIIAGGLTGVMWTFVRALSMHLQICWDISPGRKFFYWTQVIGWVVPAAIFTSAITVTGVSFRFGPGACHINHDNSIADYWAWLLAFAGCAIIVQLATMFYCFHVYLRNTWADEETETQGTESQHAPTYNSSQRAQTARAIFNRLKRVLWLQWRGLTLVTIMLIDVIYFAVIFLLLDDATVVEDVSVQRRIAPWLVCLVQNADDPAQCFARAQEWVINQHAISAVILLIAVIGPILFLLTFRFSFLVGWKKMFSSNKQEFVSLDAAQQDRQNEYPQHNAGGAMFEMQQPNKEYGADQDRIDTPSASTVGSPTEKNPALHYGYFQSSSPTPRSPQQPYTHPNPNVARSQNSYGQPTSPSGSAHVYQPAYQAVSPYGMSEKQTPPQSGGPAPGGRVPEYAHQNYQSAPQEMQQPGQPVGLAVRYEDGTHGRSPYR